MDAIVTLMCLEKSELPWIWQELAAIVAWWTTSKEWVPYPPKRWKRSVKKKSLKMYLCICSPLWQEMACLHQTITTFKVHGLVLVLKLLSYHIPPLRSLLLHPLLVLRYLHSYYIYHIFLYNPIIHDKLC